MIQITNKAAEQMLAQAAARTPTPKGLRLGIVGGGCSGFSYLLEWSDKDPEPHDTVIEHMNAKIMIDPKSYTLLDGSIFDFVTNIMGYGFRVHNPRISSSCGCDKSFSF